MPAFNAFLLLAAAMCCPPVALDRDLGITIHLYDYSGLRVSMRASAERSAEAILRHAGLVIHWHDCVLAIPATAGAPGCGAGTEDATHFVVAVLPEMMSARIATSAKQFGTSLTSRPGGFPTQAYAFVDRVSNFAAAAGTSESNLLGMIIAHEIGHLLLGNNSHFGAGIMRGKWSLEDVKSMAMGVPTFAPRQAELMRAEVRRRIEHDGLTRPLASNQDSRHAPAVKREREGN